MNTKVVPSIDDPYSSQLQRILPSQVTSKKKTLYTINDDENYSRNETRITRKKESTNLAVFAWFPFF